MRHVPSQDTHCQKVEPFDSALAAALEPAPDYDIERWLYVPPRYCDYRYILGTRSSRPLICVGINPSTAVPGALDRTLQSVERIAQANGYDSFMMFNVYAQRATLPADMEQEGNHYLHQQNMRAFSYLLDLHRPAAIWAAWGTIIEQRAYLGKALRDMAELAGRSGAHWYHAGPLSKQGHPHHPLYLRRDTPLEQFDLSAYLASFSQGT